MKLELKPYEEKMKKTIANYEENLSTIRAGRANPNALSKITVDYYGSPTPISGVAGISITVAVVSFIVGILAKQFLGVDL